VFAHNHVQHGEEASAGGHGRERKSLGTFCTASAAG
jgi:hypothetical protein